MRRNRSPLSGVDDLEFFRLVYVSPNLTAVAREIGTSLSVVSRRLSKLEQRLDVQLVNRTTRRLEVTREGRIFAERSSKILSDIEKMKDEIRQENLPLRGLVRVRASMGLGRQRIARIAAEFQALHPDVDIQLTLSSEPLGPSAAPFDVGIRVGPGRDSRLIARRIYTNSRAICATEEYLSSMPRIVDPDDLRGHNCIMLRQFDDEFSTWRFARNDETRAVRVRGSLSSNDGEVVTSWCLEGRGLMLRSRWHVDPLLQSGRLRQVLGDWSAPSADVFVTHEPMTHAPQRVLAFIEYLALQIGNTAASTSG